MSKRRGMKKTTFGKVLSAKTASDAATRRGATPTHTEYAQSQRKKREMQYTKSRAQRGSPLSEGQRKSLIAERKEREKKRERRVKDYLSKYSS